MGTLAFLFTVLVILGGLVTLVVALVHRNARLARTMGALVGGWLIVYLVVLLSVSWLTPQATVQTGQFHCFDDVCFTVLSARQTPHVGTLTAQQGQWTVVTVQYRNQARGATEKPSGTAVWLTDQQGHRYQDNPTAEAQAGSAADWTRIAAGATEERQFLFDTPHTSSGLRFGISEGAGFPAWVIIGDENSIGHQQTVWQLPW